MTSFASPAFLGALLSTSSAKWEPATQEKLRRRIASVEVKVLNPPRPGKKCLVLDIDYTLFDLVRLLGCLQSASSAKLALCWQPATACPRTFGIFVCTVTFMSQELAVLGSLSLARV